MVPVIIILISGMFQNCSRPNHNKINKIRNNFLKTCKNQLKNFIIYHPEPVVVLHQFLNQGCPGNLKITVTRLWPRFESYHGIFFFYIYFYLFYQIFFRSYITSSIQNFRPITFFLIK